ncbi:hypothetical protein F5Y12DRAFT_737988 [Xylaria sp. FL1777]|nr:hypothetical protein F5Y12DRAFT_737988 [Xylaria sp. FL1777]
MNTRRTRATTRRDESPEPSRQGPVTRQTRSSSKRVEPSGASPQSKSPYHLESGIPQRGTRRRRRRSLESVATNDFPKSSADLASPDHPAMEAPEPVSAEDTAASNIESQDDSDEDRAARLQDILDFDLPKLSRWCGKLYGALSSLTQPEPTAEERKHLRVARKLFKMARRPFAKDTAAYIDLPLSGLPYQDGSSAHATIQKITREANLISVLLSLTDLKGSKQNISTFLQDLDDDFPLFLDSDFSTQQEGYTLAFRVRCCRLVEVLKEEDLEAEALVLASILFCEQSADTSEEATQRLREGPFRLLGGDEQGGDFTCSADYKTQMGEIVGKLSVPEKAEAEESLNVMFPQDELLEDLRQWVLDTYLDMTKKMDESSDLESSSEHEEEYHQLKTLTKEPSFIQDQAALAAVRRSERGGSKGSGAESRPKSKTTKGKLTESQITDAIRRLDPAEILGDSGDDADGDIVAPGARAAGSRSRSASEELGAVGKRAHSQGDEDYVNDDDDFEVNEQVINESRRNQYDGSNVSRPAPKRSRFSVNLGKNGGRPGSPENTPGTTNMTGDDLATLSRAARANKLANKGKGHQLRERWSAADTNRLLDLIADEDLNCSWSEMEKQGGFQTYRNQQAIRDKARNLKKGYLCADAILPSGFDLVYLSKKEKNDVIASGHNPDRMEDDIDERGRVIRNLWRERSS